MWMASMVKVAWSSALFLLFVLLLMVSAEAVRTHEEFQRAVYYEADELHATAKLPQQAEVNNFDDNLDKTFDQPLVIPETKETFKELSSELQNPDAFSDNPEQHHKNFRGAAPFTHWQDGRPGWWFNPGYALYGYYPRGIPQDQQDNVIIPNRYPVGYEAREYNTRPANTEYSISSIPYDQTGGGCPTQYWISNTQRWPAFFNVKSTIGDALGTPAKNVFGETTILQALLDARTDGYSCLLRTGATAILNSYSRALFPVSHVQVMENFAAALISSQAAAQQAATFDEANMNDFTEQYNSCA